MTIGVLALDAADYRLLREWDCDNILLDRHGGIETFAYSTQHPYTPEIWATVATGLHPRDHGVVDSEVVGWENDGIDTASKVAKYAVPQSIRTRIGEMLVKNGERPEKDVPTTDSDHVFDRLYQWPGAGDASHYAECLRIHEKLVGNGQEASIEVSDQEFEEILKTNFADELAWLSAQKSGLVGTHSHILDTAGHVFAHRESLLKDYYLHADEWIGHLTDCVDELIVISDHGMQVEWLDDGSPGDHSWRAMLSVSEGIDGPLPDSVLSMESWLSWFVSGTEPDRELVSDTTEKQLSAMGYLEE